MRTSEEYYHKYTSMTGMDMDDFTETINEGRKEVIERCALLIEMKALKTREEITPKEYIDLVRSLLNEIK